MSTDAARRLQTLLGRPDRDVPLDEAVLLVAAHLHPAVDIERELGRLDELAAGVAVRTPEGVVQHLADLGFAGDADTYYDARNSLLPAVLDRRRGIPLSLAILAVEVGRRVGVWLEGIGMPGHFLLGAGPARYFDLFHGPDPLDAMGCRRVFESLQPDARWDPRLLAAVTPTAMVTRMVANLVTAHRRAGDRAALAASLRLRLLLPGAGEHDRRELAVVLAASGRYDEAAALLEGLPSERDEQAAASLRARLN